MSLSGLTVPALERLAEERGITIAKGSGADGAVLKADLVAALDAAGVSAPEQVAASGTGLYRVRRAWCGHGPGSVVEVSHERAWPFSSENDSRRSSPPHLSPLVDN